jgi:predicted AlkP superfamily phosphohydrolase/phosphomutase
MNASTPAGRRSGPVFVLGLDAFEVDLLERWSEEGRLPFLTSLMNQGAFTRLRSTTFSDAPWPTLVSGTSPGTHAFYTHLQLKRGTYEIERLDARHCRALPFWNLLRGSGLRVALFDVPKTFPIEGVDGIQVCGWGEHYPLLKQPESIPRGFVGELQARFGAYPHLPDVTSPSRPWERRTYETFLQNVDRKLHATEHLLGLGPWDFFFAVFSEVHYGDHQFFHYAHDQHWAYDANSPADLKGALPQLASRLDSALARIDEQLPRDTNLFVISVHGIEANFSANHLVPQILARMGVLVPAERAAPSNALGSLLLRTQRLRALIPQGFKDFINTRLLSDAVHDQAYSSAFAGSVDWKRTRAFLLPSDHFQAFISLNLEGREPDGFVQPGAEADALFAEIRHQFLRLVNAGTGRPAVQQVDWVPGMYPGPAEDCLPDIVVHWAKDAPIDKLVHPDLGTFSAPGFPLRTSQHTPNGFLIARGPAIDEAAAVPDASSLDIAPTLLHLLGQPVPLEMQGRVLFEFLKSSFREQHAGLGSRRESAQPVIP